MIKVEISEQDVERLKQLVESLGMTMDYECHYKSCNEFGQAIAETIITPDSWFIDLLEVIVERL